MVAGPAPAEAMHWARAEQLWRECYCKPFQPPRHVSSTTNRLHAPRDVPVPESSSTALLQQVLRVVRAAARAGGTGGLSAHDIARELWRGGERVAGSSPSAQHDHGSAAGEVEQVLQVSDSLRAEDEFSSRRRTGSHTIPSTFNRLRRATPDRGPARTSVGASRTQSTLE